MNSLNMKYSYFDIYMEMAKKLYENYRRVARETGRVAVRIEKVIDPICKEKRMTRFDFGKEYLERIQMMCLRGEVPYGMMLEVDATYREQAAWWRRKKENQVWAFGTPVCVIEMKERTNAKVDK